MRFLLCLMAFLYACPASASPGKCFLRVHGKIFLNAICNVEMNPDDGSFSIGTGEQNSSKYFAFVNIDPEKGVARGYWNGVEAESHAHEDLGILVRKGACWENKRAKVCAWRLKNGQRSSG